jgi:hypothetical protein
MRATAFVPGQVALFVDKMTDAYPVAGVERPTVALAANLRLHWARRDDSLATVKDSLHEPDTREIASLHKRVVGLL